MQFRMKVTLGNGDVLVGAFRDEDGAGLSFCAAESPVGMPVGTLVDPKDHASAIQKANGPEILVHCSTLASAKVLRDLVQAVIADLESRGL